MPDLRRERTPKPADPPPVFVCGRHTFVLDRPLIMGVVNVTPDSFSDGGKYFDADQAIAHGQRLIEQGAQILDIGGESTRPGAEPVDEQEELRRVLPVLEGLQGVGAALSIDTRRPAVMRKALSMGVDLLNDVNGFRDPQAFEIAAQSSCGVCIMHMQGEPQAMQKNPHYDDVVREVGDFLFGQRDAFVHRGVPATRILIDPGFGFGKTLEHNLSLLQALSEFAKGQLLAVGLSRKSMIGALSGQAHPADRAPASVAAALWAAGQGAHVLRVHDVEATRDALTVWHALEMRRASGPDRAED